MLLLGPLKNASACEKPLAAALIHDASVFDCWLQHVQKKISGSVFNTEVASHWEIGHNEIWGTLKLECVL